MNTVSLNAALLSEALQLTEHNQPYAWATVVRATPPSSAYVGAQAIVTADGTLHGWVGGGCARSIVVQSCLEAIEHGNSKLIRISNEEGVVDTDTEVHAMPCASNGTLELFIQSVNPTPALCIAGSTHAAIAAGEFAAMLGWRVFYEQPDGGSGDGGGGTAGAGGGSSHEGDKRSAADSMRQAGGSTYQDNGPEPDYVLVATQGEDDIGHLERALKGPAKKVLLIASTRKAATLVAAMRQLGISEDRLADLESPAGPDILAGTPSEVALAAVAGLVRAHRAGPDRAHKDGHAGHAEETESDAAQATHDTPSPATLAQTAPAEPASPPAYINPVCLRAINQETALHTVTMGDQTHYFCCNCCKTKFDEEPEKYLDIARNMNRPL
ncbi:MAG TPA: XdhC family protein [Pusillimonas sp.]|uniref:XdhC family protein n=1 Tax=Pusillimonas sp. TaxID=3040095 RepID=UPI002CF723C8|nr:XdhC family protein [Pusillimonas sp.]HUH88086.1 XdhC family protein [Pusillimonas sp.]